jgi:hypothetical protein
MTIGALKRGSTVGASMVGLVRLGGVVTAFFDFIDNDGFCNDIRRHFYI